jgi:hypothetical protein
MENRGAELVRDLAENTNKNVEDIILLFRASARREDGSPVINLEDIEKGLGIPSGYLLNASRRKKRPTVSSSIGA